MTTSKRLNSLGLAAIGTVLVTGLAATSPAEAVPAFARQTGMACLSCHFQSFPSLNSFGRAFKAGGYTMRGAQGLVEGDNLSLPDTLNASLITKIRYQLVEGVKGGRGEIQWPDEAALLVGGRATENTGFLAELSLIPQAVVGTADLTTGEVSGDTEGGNFTSVKYHFNVTDNFAAIVFGTDALGVGYGFELLNTGGQRSQRPIEQRKGMSATQILGLDGAAEGVALVYHADELAVAYSHWAPVYGNVNANIVGGLNHYVRAIYTPTLGSWDTGFGVAMMSGTVKVGAGDPPDAEVKVASTVIDAQMQGDLSDTMTLGVYASYGTVPKSSAGGTANAYNTSTTSDKTATAAVAKLGVGRLTPYLGYATSKNGSGKKQTDTTLGVSYSLAQNINLDISNVQSDAKGKDQTLISLFSAF